MWQVFQVGSRLYPPFAAPRGPVLLQDQVHRHPMEPGPERTLAAETSDSLPTPDEHILSQFSRPSCVPGHAQAQGVDSFHVVSVQRLECLDVPRLHPRHQGRDVGG